jgi:hypothetical protein
MVAAARGVGTRLGAAIVLALALLVAPSAAAQIITTIAGGGFGCADETDAWGDGCPATMATLLDPEDVFADSCNNVFIADAPLVRRVDATTGIITAVAGNGSPRYCGDGIPATEACISTSSVALDAAGNLYIAGTGNARIFRVDAVSTILTTIAGTGIQGYSGDGGPATAAQIECGGQCGVATDVAGNVYIADWGNGLVRRVDAATGVITTVAGVFWPNPPGCPAETDAWGDGCPATSAALATMSVRLDGAGNLYIDDMGHNQIRKVDAATGIITAIAGDGIMGSNGDGGPATGAELYQPDRLGLDSQGNVLFSDGEFTYPQIRRIDATTGIITTVAGGGDGCPGEYDVRGDGCPPTEAWFADEEDAICDPSGNLYTADDDAWVRKMTLECVGTGTPPLAAAKVRRTTIGSCAAVQPTTTALASSLNPSLSGESVTFKATLSPYPGPTGSVAFTADSTAIGSACNAVALTAASVTCTTSALAVGSHAMLATYSGDSSYGPSSGSLTQVVESPSNSTTTALGSDLNPSLVAEAVTFSATVAPSAATGTVAFTADGATLGGCGAVALSAGSARCTTSALAVGSHAMLATYSGDSTYAGSSGSMTQQVLAPSGGGDFSISVSPAEQIVHGSGQAVYTVTVAPQNGFVGPVTLSCDGAPSGGSCVFSPSTVNLLDSSVQATMTVSTAQTSAGLFGFWPALFAPGTPREAGQRDREAKGERDEGTERQRGKGTNRHADSAAAEAAELRAGPSFLSAVTELPRSIPALDRLPPAAPLPPGALALEFPGSRAPFSPGTIVPLSVSLFVDIFRSPFVPLSPSPFVGLPPSPFVGLPPSPFVPLPPSPFVPLSCLSLCLCVSVVGIPGKRRRRLLLALALLALALGLGSCGCPSTRHQIYTITVTGTDSARSPALAHSASVSLVVQ